MKPTFLKTSILGLALLSPMCLAGQSVAEYSDPFATLSVTTTSPQYSPKKQVSGAFKIQSSEALHPLLARLSADFQRLQPKITLDVKKGNPKSMTEFLQAPLRKTGKILMIDDRPSSFQLLATTHRLSDAETKEFVAQHGYEPTVVPLAIDAVALYVHKDNPLPGLTLDQVDGIFSSTRKRGAKTDISQWSHLGLSEDWKEAPIRLYGRDRRSEARATFQEHALAGGDFKPGVLEHPGAASVAVTLNENPIGIGYSALGLQTANLRAVPIAEKDGMPFVLPSRETVADQTYPLRHTLYVYFDKAPTASLPDAVQEFLTFIASREGENVMIKAGLFPLPPAQGETRAAALGGSTERPASISQ